MELTKVFNILLITQFVAAIAVFIILRFFSAPYGRHNRKGWGLTMQSKYAWMIMELPAFLIMPVFLIIVYPDINIVSIVYIVIWETHYIYRTFIFSNRIRGSRKTFPVLVLFFSLTFNCMNGFINAYFIFFLNNKADINWFGSPIFIIGLFLFISGFCLNIYSDKIIRNLRKPGESVYKIPVRGPFRFVTNPNYLGEIIEWLGWALLCWSLPGLAFAFFSFANLAPRAISNHNWYHKNFQDYPQNRKILLPFIF